MINLFPVGFLLSSSTFFLIPIFTCFALLYFPVNDFNMEERKTEESPLLNSSNSSSPPTTNSPFYSKTPDEYQYNEKTERSPESSLLLNGYKYVLYGLLAILMTVGFVSTRLPVSLEIESKFIEVPDLVRVKSLTPHHTPSHKHGNRLILIGDIHGKLDEFQELIEKVHFNPKKDHLVLLGDMVAKGPDSVGVLDYAMAFNASCVRGNHEDNVLHAYASLHKLPTPKISPPPQGILDDIVANTPLKTLKSSDLDVAKKLEPRHIKYLGSCPAIISLGRVGFHNTQAVAVHAGLQWNIDTLEAQDPETVFTIRSLVPPDYKVAHEKPDGKPWSTVWSQKQDKRKKNDRMSVYYGHDARLGLNVREYSAGLDTGCYKGGKLTAMIISENKDGKPKHTIKHVSCSG